jgi:drug/metabolite transporter (DMT)-like permease
MGTLLAFAALCTWGLGDFLIQRSSRRFGSVVTLFSITGLAALVLLPFVWGEIISTLQSGNQLKWLLGGSVVITIAALLNFESLRRGKISVIEPIYAGEIPVTAILASVVLGEHLTLLEIGLICLLVLGIAAVSTESVEGWRQVKLEPGLIYAVFGTIAMGTANFLLAAGGRVTSVLMVNWFTDVWMAVIMLVVLLYRRQLLQLVRAWRSSPGLMSTMTISDNLAWLTYTASALFIPIAIATSISETYIAVAAVLGLIINKETLRPHQYVGMIAAIGSAIALGALAG